MKRISMYATLALVLVVVFAALASPVAEAHGGGPTKTPEPSHKVDICHKNNGNGWSDINVDDDSVNGSGSGDHNRDGHQDGQDIIPPFYDDGHAGTWAPRNWDAEGQAIFRNGCEVPSTPTPTATFTLTPTPTDTDTPTSTPTDTPTETPTDTATPTETATDEPTPTSTNTPENTPTDVATPTLESTHERTPNPPEPSVTPTRVPRCKKDPVPCGWSWHLVGPEGQTAWFTSFSLRPGGDPFEGEDWYPPNAQSQQRCLGWVHVSNLPGRPYFGVEPLISCDGGKCVPN